MNFISEVANEIIDLIITSNVDVVFQLISVVEVLFHSIIENLNKIHQRRKRN